MDSPPKVPGEKLRLMCSYGGHIIPRPHDKSLCYAGGETRLVAVSRKTTAASLSTFTNHLSKSLYNSRPFSLKYQLPHHDLDSLISISTDEDLINMIDEYDRLSASPTPERIRFFLFPEILPHPKTEDWFIDALRNAGVSDGSGKAGSGSGAESVVLEEREREGSFGSTGSSNFPAVHFQDIKVALPSLDSLGSDSSIPSPNFSQQAIVYHDASGFPDSKPVSANLVETESNVSERSPRSDVLTPVQISSYILSKPMDQSQQQGQPSPSPTTPPQQYIHHPPPQSHYVTQNYPNLVQVGSYPTMYQPYVQAQQPVQYQINKQYPVYMMPVGQAQNPYDMSMQCSLATTQKVAPSQPQVPSNPIVVTSPMVYEGYKPAVPTASAPEYAAKVYRPNAVAAQPVTVSTDDHHHQVVAFPPVNPPSQPVAVSPLENSNYTSEYEDPMHAQIYKTQPSVPTLPSQLQTTTNTAAVMLSESFTQLQVENAKH